MVFVKNLQFFHVFIFHKISQQIVFDVILESKKCFKTIIKNRKLKKSKNQDFLKEYCILGKIGQENVFDL